MRVRAIIPSAAALVSLLACREELPTFRPVWPPEEGAYCADAGDVCGADGTPWLCGPRPLWRRLDCAAICAAEGGSPQGCLVKTSEDIGADRASIAPLGFIAKPDAMSPAESHSVRCLCREPAEIECAGPSHRVCAGHTAIWSCGPEFTWERQECGAKCAAQNPPMAVDECEHDAPYTGEACRCTMLGAPCFEEGHYLCAGDATWLRCDQGTWVLDVDCHEEIKCEWPEYGVCDRYNTQAVACRCEAQ